MSFFHDFKKFLLKGDIVHLSVAVVIGAAFGKIVTAFTKQVLMPPIGLLLGKVNFNELQWVLIEATQNEAGEVLQNEVAIGYGAFIQTVVDFVIIGFAIFILLRAYEKSKKKEVTPPPPAKPTQEELLKEIRDLLKK